MTLHPFDPAGGYRVHEEIGTSAIVELAGGLLLHGHIISCRNGNSVLHLLNLSYAYREIVAQKEGKDALVPAYRWATGESLGTIPIHPDTDVPFGERLRRSLADAFGTAPQARLLAVLTLARLRQDAMGWAEADLVLNDQHPRGVLRTQRGQQKLSTILLRADRGRRPPDLHAFLGPAAQLRLAEQPYEQTRILRRPVRAGPRPLTSHGRMAAILDLLALFAAHGVDLSPWQDDLLA